MNEVLDHVESQQISEKATYGQVPHSRMLLRLEECQVNLVMWSRVE